jgi:putative addiction module component (TIGR02574 family)
MTHVPDALLRGRLDTMGAEARRVLETALALSDEERAEIAVGLLASLDGEPDADAEQAWAAEITRRAESVLRGEAKLVDWEDVDAEAARLVRE